MPDIRNEDIMKIVCLLNQKVDKLEGKLDQVLSLLSRKNHISTEELFDNDIDYNFKYTPIDNDEALERVSNIIEESELYRKNLIRYMQAKKYLKLEHIFTDTFLCDYNIPGTKGKKKLAGLPPYDQIYAYIKFKEGLTEEDITKAVMRELKLVRGKVRTRKKRYYPNSNENKEAEANFRGFDLDQETNKASNFPTEQVFVEQIDTEMNEVNVKEEDDNDDDDESDDDYFSFSPINSEQKLQRISQKIKSEPQYLQNLRVAIVDGSGNGKCILKQLFTAEFLQNYSLNGKYGKNLSQTVPYKEIYVYLKNHSGQSLKEINTDALDELKRIASQQKIKRKRGEMPRFVSKKSKINEIDESSEDSY